MVILLRLEEKMTKENYVDVDVRRGGMESAVVHSPIEGLANPLLEDEGYSQISLAENAHLRILEGANSLISNTSNWVKEGMISIDGRGDYLTRHSAIFDRSVVCGCCKSTGRVHMRPTYEDTIEKYLADSVQFKGPIPTKRFKDDEVTLFAFQGYAEDYGNFLREEGVKELKFTMPYSPKYQNEVIFAQAIFGNLYESNKHKILQKPLPSYWPVEVSSSALIFNDYPRIRGVRKTTLPDLAAKCLDIKGDIERGNLAQQEITKRYLKISENIAKLPPHLRDLAWTIG
jgi:hypothetical protein